jgi:hypothetical protein
MKLDDIHKFSKTSSVSQYHNLLEKVAISPLVGLSALPIVHGTQSIIRHGRSAKENKRIGNKKGLAKDVIWTTVAGAELALTAGYLVYALTKSARMAHVAAKLAQNGKAKSVMQMVRRLTNVKNLSKRKHLLTSYKSALKGIKGAEAAGTKPPIKDILTQAKVQSAKGGEEIAKSWPKLTNIVNKIKGGYNFVEHAPEVMIGSKAPKLTEAVSKVLTSKPVKMIGDVSSSKWMLPAVAGTTLAPMFFDKKKKEKKQ